MQRYLPSLQDRFLTLLQRHVPKLKIHGSKATGLALCHEDRSPSFSANLDKCVWYCHACSKGGGAKDFALLVGEPWGSASLPRREKARAAVSIRRREAEQKARAVLAQREEKRLDEIFDEWREANSEATSAAELLGVFHRHLDLEKEFSDLAEKAARDHGEAVSGRVLLEAQIDGEVA